MSEKLFFKLWLFVVFLGVGTLVSGGCAHFADDEHFYDLKVAPEKLRQIETLDLENISTKATGNINVNRQAADKIELTLEQSRALALANNLDLKVQLISPAIAAEKVSEQEARFEAVFFSNMTFSKTDTPTSTTLSSLSELS